MKKTKMLVAVIAIVLGLSTAVQAKLPPNSIMVGSNVYDSGYLQNPANLLKVNDELMNNLGSIYFIDESTKAKDMFTGSTVEDSEIISKVGNTLTYYTGQGTKQKIVTDAKGEFTDPTNMNSDMFAIANINYKPLTTGLFMYSVRITELEGVNNAAYFKIGSSSITPLADTCNYIEGMAGGNNLISIYASDGLTELANGQVDFSRNNAGGSLNLSIILNPTKHDEPIDETTHGNTASNITNTGFAAIDNKNKWIYYQNTADKNKLYRKSVTGVENYVISDDSVKYINVVGDWVYYSNFDDEGKIYKVRLDGTQKQKISDDMASCINVVGSKIYYINNSDRGRIYVMDSQGRRQLIGDAAKLMGLGDINYLFYINGSDGNKLYSYDLLNNRKTKISDINTEFISVVNDYSIFYTGKDGNLYRSTNSQGQTPIPMPIITNVPQRSGRDDNMQGLNDKATTIYANDENNIYYRSYVDGGKIYKLDSTGNGYKVVDAPTDFMNITGDSLYYMKSGKLYVTPKDSDGTTKGMAVPKPKLNEKVTKIDDIPLFTTDDITKFNFPERVSCIMSDGTIRQLVVNWNKTAPKPQKGIYNFTGNILGYGNKVTMSVALDSGTLDATKIKVVNEIGSKDTITISGLDSKLNQGDIVSVYTNMGDIKPLKTAVVDKNGNVLISGLNLNVDGGNIYVSITKTGKAEGSKVSVAVPAEAPVGFLINAQNQEISGLKPTKQYKVYINDQNQDGTIPPLPMDFVTVTANDKGVITVGNMKTKIENGKDNRQMLRVVAVGNVDSMPSAPVEISKGKIPDYVSIDLNLGRILGTSTNMQYRYNNNEEWKDCQPGTTPISMTMSLEVQLKVKASGPVIESDVKKFGLFPMPVVKGIENGKIYSTKNGPDGKSEFPEVTWNEDNPASGITYTARLTKKDGTVVSDSVTPLTLLDALKGVGNGEYVLTVTATKSDPNMNPQTATNSVVINFTINSAAPAKPDVTMIEKGGKEPGAGAPETYWQATPTWINLAGTYSEAKITMKKTADGLPGSVKYNEIANPAEVAFVRGNTITQNGEYELRIVTTSTENGSKSEVVKTFRVNSIDKALTPDVKGISEGGRYNKEVNAEIKDKDNCTTIATLMRDGYITPYTSGDKITINGHYVLILKTTNKINGDIKETRTSFDMDNLEAVSQDIVSATVDKAVSPNTVVVKDNIPYGSIIKVYSSVGSVIGSQTNNGPSGPVTVTIPNGIPAGDDFIYVTRTDSGKQESNKVKVNVTKTLTIKSVSPTTFTETAANDGAVSGTRLGSPTSMVVVEIQNGVIKDDVSKTDVTASNMPEGLHYDVQKLDDTHLGITITGNANNNEVANSINNLTFTIKATKLTDATGAADITTGPININFNGSPKAVENIVATDVGNNNNGTDLQVSFSKSLDETSSASTTKVGSYRVIVVKNSKSLKNIEEANAVSLGNCTVVQKTGSDLKVKLDGSARDSDGDAIANGDYKIYVLSVADGTNANLNSLAGPAQVTLNAAALAPTVSNATTVDATHIKLTMSGALTGNSADTRAFSITGVASNPNVTGVAVSGTTVTLTLDKAITSGDILKVSYATTGTNDLTNGTKVANFSNQTVTNTVSPTVLSAKTLNNNIIELTMSSALIGGQGDKAAFTISGASANPKVSAVGVVGEKVTLTLDNSIAKGETIKVTYIPTGTNNLTNGITLVTTFTNQVVTNNN